MADDPDEIYSAPAENQTTNFADIRKMFNNPGVGIPIKVAHDGRHQNKGPDSPGINKPSKSFKPNYSTKPKLFDGNTPPSLPNKKISPKPEGSKPPKLPETVVNGAALLGKSNRLSDRPESMFPPAAEKDSDSNNNKKKGPLSKPPVNGLVSPTSPLPPTPKPKDSSPRSSPRDAEECIHTPTGTFRKRPLPPEGHKPPTKPPSIPAHEVRLPSVTIGGHRVLSPAKSITEVEDVEGVEPDEIYDDIAAPPPSDASIATPSTPATPNRPISMIPVMTEDDEEDLSDGELNRRLCAKKGRLPAVADESDGETYDDVAPGLPPPPAGHPHGPPPPPSGHPPAPGDDMEEIYEDI